MNIEIVSKMCVLIKFIYWALCRLWKAEGETSIKIHLHFARSRANIHISYTQQLCKQTYARKKRTMTVCHESKAFAPFSLGLATFSKMTLCAQFDNKLKLLLIKETNSNSIPIANCYVSNVGAIRTDSIR